MSRAKRYHITSYGTSFSRFARCHEVLPYSVQAAVNLMQPTKPACRGGMMDGQFQTFWVSSHRSRSGVRYNRLLRLRQRLFINREQGRRVNR